jgi:hypothetical protein
MLKLSDAILLGSTIKKHGFAGQIFDGDGGACAVGMAYAAAGMSREGWRFLRSMEEAEKIRHLDAFLENRGWLWARDTKVYFPSWAPRVGVDGVFFVITDLYDNFVCTGKATLEMLVDWVRSVEDELGVYANGSSEGLDDKVPSDSPKLDCLPEEGAVTLGTAGNCVVNTAPASVTLVT